MAPRPLHELCGQCDVEQCGGIVPLTRAPPHPHDCSSVPSKPGFITKNLATFCQSVTFHGDLAGTSVRSCRCSVLKGSAQRKEPWI
ncbi:hypothetical protein TNCV_1949041 [Trichonephila clavipes]|nr:hypothetical protein TNCV_1949041 [Trichonephila clavipes]